MALASPISQGYQTDIRTLQQSTVTKACWMSLALAYSWFLAHVWLTDAGWQPRSMIESLGSWLGLLFLIVSGVSALWLRKRHLREASYVVVWGLAASVVLALIGYNALDVSYLWALPILFSSVLMRPRSAFLFAGMAVLSLRMYALVPSANADGAYIPAATLLVLAVASYVFSRNLYTALHWTWDEWRRAGENEREARERRAELRRALRALDGATARLERTNYMLALARDQAQEARRLKQQFAQTLSHELRTPLNLITGFSDLMVQSPDYYGSPLPVTYRRDLSIVHRNAHHLKALVDDVLDLARIDAAQMSLTIEETAPADLVKSAIDIVRSLVEAHDVALNHRLQADLPSVHVDQMRIRQVLVNLLNNAARFTDEGSIEVSVSQCEGDIVFAVTDTGVGISPEELSRIFQEFHQVDSTSRRRHQGAGLGLAICQRFVKMHGGRIWAESEPGQGSTFSFAIPLTPHERLGNLPQESIATQEGAVARASDKLVAIAVTHSASAANLLSRYLVDCRTVAVPSLGEAAKAALRLMPQVIVVDTTSYPNPHEQLEAILDDPKLANCMGVAVPLPGEESNRRTLDADGYLLKPVSRQALWDALRQFGEQVDTVLLIDDDEGFVQLMRRMLHDPVRRYQVTSAGTGVEALASLARSTPDLVLLDLMLPDMDGSQVLAAIRANPQWSGTPVVVVSAQDDPGEATALGGSMAISRAGGLLPSQALRLMQTVVQTTSSQVPPKSDQRSTAQ